MPARTATVGHVEVPVPVSGPERYVSWLTADASAELTLVPNRSHSTSHEGFTRDQDPTPRATNDPWRFTPSLLDGTFSFSNFTNQAPGYYTPTPGGTNTIYHPQAGDLHTPSLSFGMGLGTPLSMPNSEGAAHSGAMDMAGFHHGFHPQQFPPQFHHPFIQPPPPQPSYAPSSFMHQDTGYETMDQDGSPMDSDHADDRIGSIDSSFPGQSPMEAFQARQFGLSMSVPLPASAEKFRFHTALNAPTAMIRHADEIPVTYLNKGQAYSLSVVDTTPNLPIAPGTRLRTFVRVSFEDEQQRQKPGVCWSLWKEGRGTNEAHQRGGKLQAVEYVEAGQPAEGDDKKTRVELETSSFDGFSVIWTPGVNGVVECHVAVRFNFLSTDFSHSKGVKGIPVRLCAKTYQLPADGSPPAEPANAAEICYCKVKLFRDHGAERKLSNDVAHVRKTIDKLKQQIAQAESGMKDFSKRKRATGGSAQAKHQNGQRPGKALKHKRTWSMSSASSAGGANPRVPLEEDLHFKLQTLQDMFTSTRPVSVLYLRGEDLDDPDLHPVSLPGDSTLSPDTTTTNPNQSSLWRSSVEPSSLAGSSLVSPSPSSLSLHSQAAPDNNTSKTHPLWQPHDAGHHYPPTSTSTAPTSTSNTSSNTTTKVPHIRQNGSLTGWIEALGVDASYRPPARDQPKPVACFFVHRHITHQQVGGKEDREAQLHRAIYLSSRTAHELVGRLAGKFGFDVSRVVRVVRVVGEGRLEVEVDDEVVREMEEGVGVGLEVLDVNHLNDGEGGNGGVKGEWEGMEMDGMVVDSSSASSGEGVEVRLWF